MVEKSCMKRDIPEVDRINSLDMRSLTTRSRSINLWQNDFLNFQNFIAIDPNLRPLLTRQCAIRIQVDGLQH